jgi:hypothetical protein
MNSDIGPGHPRRTGGGAVLAIALLAACGGGEPADAHPPADALVDAAPSIDARDGFWLSGTVRAETGAVPAAGVLLALWATSDDEPRTGMHKRGELRRTGTTSEMPFPVPPAEARIVPELAVALLLDIAADAAVPADGDIDDEDLPTVQGGTIAHAVFHRTGDTGEAWADAFPLGFSCGRCVQNPDDNEHDHYVPVPCGEVEVVTGLPDDARGCNWR